MGGLQVAIATGGMVAVILVSIPWLKAPLGRLGLSYSGAFAQSVLMVIVVSIFFEVRRLANRENGEADPSHLSDPMDVYPILFKRAKDVTRQEEKVVDVLGISLYTAWPSIRFWLNRPQLNGWTVRLAALAGDEHRLANQVPSSWSRDARKNLNNIVEYGESPAAKINNVRVQAFSYNFMPALHGYRLGNGDLFYSILHWNGDGHLSLDDYTYEFVPREDASPSADAIRHVFDSWFQRATRDAWTGKGKDRR